MGGSARMESMANASASNHKLSSSVSPVTLSETNPVVLKSSNQFTSA